ncbi:MAG: hypothetical protein Kow0079_05780 [Vicingaceae bacterium]
MKKHYIGLLLFAFGYFNNTNAQITINSTDVVDVNDIVVTSVDTIPSGVNIGNSGANQTWTFTSVVERYVDTAFFVAPGTLPGSANFPNANMGLYQSSDDSSYIFLNKSTSALTMEGNATYINGQLTALPFTSVILPFPASYGMSSNGSWASDLFSFYLGIDPDGPGPYPFIDSVKVSRGSNWTYNIDGWGNVTTSFGTFPALRQTTVTYNIDTTWTYSNGSWAIIDPVLAAAYGIDPISYDTTGNARWWSNDPNTKFPVVEIEYDVNNGNAQKVTWQKQAPFVGVNEITATNNVNVFPNPALNEVTIQSKNLINQIAILDITGKTIFKRNYNHLQQVTVDLDNFTSGIYFVQIKNSNEAIETRKLIIE